MKTLHELRTEQQSEVNYYRSIAQKAVQQLVVPQQALIEGPYWQEALLEEMLVKVHSVFTSTSSWWPRSGTM